MLTLFPKQAESRDHLLAALRKHGAAIDTSDTGTGKTVKALETARFHGLPLFIVAPKAVLTAWRRAAEAQGVPVTEVINYEKLRNGGTHWLDKTGKRKVEWKLASPHLVIFDEAHRCVGTGTLNGKMLEAADEQGHSVLMLSATLCRDPSEMNAVGKVLGIHNGKGFLRWARQWGCSLDPWNKLVFPKRNHHKLDDLNRILYPEYGHKLTREDLGEHFNETRIDTTPLDFGLDDIQRAYDELTEQIQHIESLEQSENAQANIMVAELRARQKIEMVKVPLIADLVKEEVEQGNSVAVFLNFRESISALESALGMPVALIHGDVKAEQRQANVDAFQNDDVHVAIVQVQAGGVGLSLHDTHGLRPRVALICPSYNEKDLVQVLGRVDRVGAKTPSRQRILFAAGTIEEEVEKTVRKKLEAMKKLHSAENLLLTPAAESPKMGKMNPLLSESPPASGPQGHHPLGPSKHGNWAACPGFLNHDGPVHPTTLMGTRVHDAVERDDPSGLQSEYEHGLFGAAIEYREAIFGEGSPGQREVRLAANLGDGLDYWGTCDHLLVNGRSATAADWKFGNNQVKDAEHNAQVLAYTIAIFQMFPEVMEITFYIVQPPLNLASRATFTRDDLPWMEATTRKFLSDHLRAKADPTNLDLLNPCDMCQYCKRNIEGTCRALEQKAVAIAKAYAGDELEIPEIVHTSETDDAAIIARNYKLAQILEKWVDGVKNRAKNAHWEEGLELPGLKAIETRGNRLVSATDAYHVASQFIPGLTPDDVLAMAGEISFNSLAEFVKERAPARGKTKAVNEFELALRGANAIRDAAPRRFFKSVKDDTTP